MSNHLKLIVALLGLIALAKNSADGATVAFDSSAAGSGDASIISGTNANTNFDTYTALQVAGGNIDNSRSFLQFNVSSLAGQYQSIDAITLRLTTSYNTPASGIIDVHQVLSGWLESQVTYNDRLTATPWTAAGGDYVGTTLGSLNRAGLSVSAAFDGVQQQVTISLLAGPSNAAARLALLNAWTTGSNFGLLLKSATEPSGVNSYLGFRDRSRALASDRPLLTIDYTPVPVPEPLASVLAIYAAVAFGVCLRGRRIRFAS